MIVTAFHKAMQRLMCTLGLPVYAEGRVPDEACYPYIVWSSTEAAGQESGTLTVAGWFRGNHIECLHLADQLLALLPDQPTAMPFEGGFALLRTQEVYQKTDAADTSVEGCCLKVQLRCYTYAEEDEQ